MSAQLSDWERPQFAAGGGDPFLFYVVYGDVDPKSPMSRSRYRSDGIPPGIEVMWYGPPNTADVPQSFREGYLWDEFVQECPTLAASVQTCESCLILRGKPDDSKNLNYLRDTVGLITHFLDCGGCAVYDPQMFRWWEPTPWRQQIFDPAAAVPRHHTVILVSEEADPTLKWFHTRGMRKFGRPDISVHDVPAELESGVIDLCNRLIEHQAFGHMVAEGQQIKMAGLPSSGIIRHQGDLDDPDFNNVHLEVMLNRS